MKRKTKYKFKDIKTMLQQSGRTFCVVGSPELDTTMTVVLPTMESLAQTKPKPSFVVTYSKDEFYEELATKLRCQGYNVSLLDFVDDACTNKENLFNEILKKTDEMIEWNITDFMLKNEFNFSNFEDEPTALFLRVSSESTTKNRLVTLLVQQIYGALVNKANRNQECGKTKWEELLRSVYFVMDEFGTLPRIRDFDRMIAIAQGRKIFLLPVVQSCKQLDAVYGKDMATYIRTWCIFIEPNDDKKGGDKNEE